MLGSLALTSSSSSFITLTSSLIFQFPFTGLSLLTIQSDYVVSGTYIVISALAMKG
ncbi:hypothetical protein BU16DRAFT_526813 [Lophium mytilinum]|uniref:Uncharacterized protein n=1 Tax=Lophium mytilinum TaxID=390894 RepID=A0A6A6QV97_9PEZI|nr:hypothetical protein BU16DRAFT_526813 [Lophium mytilinum]